MQTMQAITSIYKLSLTFVKMIHNAKKYTNENMNMQMKIGPCLQRWA
jgi:hypothetical protein